VCLSPDWRPLYFVFLINVSFNGTVQDPVGIFVGISRAGEHLIPPHTNSDTIILLVSNGTEQYAIEQQKTRYALRHAGLGIFWFLLNQ